MQKTPDSQLTLDKKTATGIKIAIIKTNYHKEWVDNLAEYCSKTLNEYGVLEKNIAVFIAPGSWEIPLLAQAVAKTKNYNAIITFGVIIKGDTYHFEMIANECSRALMQLSLDYSIPIAMEVLAVNTIAQAKERSNINNQNKGIEGATAVLQALTSIQQINTK